MQICQQLTISFPSRNLECGKEKEKEVSNHCVWSRSVYFTSRVFFFFFFKWHLWTVNYITIATSVFLIMPALLMPLISWYVYEMLSQRNECWVTSSHTVHIKLCCCCWPASLEDSCWGCSFHFACLTMSVRTLEKQGNKVWPKHKTFHGYFNVYINYISPRYDIVTSKNIRQTTTVWTIFGLYTSMGVNMNLRTEWFLVICF